ncbi:MAG TPA: RDD family protein [Chitinophagales bacterium]|nr:RDD family protein [Chitinophagales bacterium]
MSNVEYKNLYEDKGALIPRNYAGFGVRMVAFFIDGVILSFAFGIISFITGMKFNSGFFEVVYNPGGLLSFLLALSYFVYFETGEKQATIGKSIMDLKVVKQNGAKMTVRDSVFRYIGKIFSAFIFMIGYIMAIFDDQKRTLHDRIAETYVIKI